MEKYGFTVAVFVLMLTQQQCHATCAFSLFHVERNRFRSQRSRSTLRPWAEPSRTSYPHARIHSKNLLLALSKPPISVRQIQRIRAGGIATHGPRHAHNGACDTQEWDAHNSLGAKDDGGVGGGDDENLHAPTVRDILKFAIPAIGIWLCGPLLSLIDTSAVGLLSGTAQLAALNPAITVTDDGALLVVSTMHNPQFLI